MIFKNKKAELVKDKAIVEIEECAERVLKNLKWSFDVMQERDDFEKLYELEKNKNKGLELKINEKSEKITTLNLELIRTKQERDALLNFLDKVAVAFKDTNENFVKEIENLKSDRYLVVKQRATKATTQKLGIKSGTKNSKIIKKVKEG